MTHISRWKTIFIIAVCLLGFAYSAPNLLDKDARVQWQASVPSWLPSKTVNLGLDLQGGSQILLQVDVAYAIHNRSESLVDGLRPELRERKIGYTKIGALPEGGVRLTLSNKNDADAVKEALRELEAGLDILVSDEGVVEARLLEPALKEIRDQTISQSVEIVRRRVDETGTKEPTIVRQGDDRIMLQLPGVEDPERVKTLLGKTAQLGFHLVDDTGRGAAGTRLLPMEDDPARKIPVQRRAIITGDMLANAQTSFQDGMAVVAFKLNGIGARRFCDVTRQNAGKPFAIVLDNEIISAPVIREAICGGSGVISGGFTVQTANDLALLLRAGALPAPLSVMEERTVGPTLGTDSIQAGKIAGIIGFALVVVCMGLVYSLFGVFASLALIVNVALIFALLSALQATLTLPGIAGIVLTMGMAVDANVLIFERIREEINAGRSPVSAIGTGYSQAMRAIVDSNLTTLIAAVILYSFGTGPIKGFAVTMSIGILTSMFTAVMVTRLMVLGWIRRARPSALPV